MGEAAFHWSLGASIRRQLEDQAQAAWSVGDLIGGRYTILSQLGAGATGVVYRARDPEAGREVAIKTLNPECDLPRFEREGELAAALVHPGIGRVYSSGRDGERSFIVYELIEGCRPLSEALPELARPERLRIVAEVARAVGHAHRQGVLHRDLKPANIVLDREGRARVIDFGMGKRDAGDDPGLTEDGAMVGTPLFMSPEQFAGRAHGPGVDVWALGVLLYLVLTDRHPFTASGLAELAQRVQGSDPVSPCTLDPTIPPALAEVCMRALRRDPGQRHADANAFGAHLAELERGGSPPGRGRLAWLALAVGSVAVLALTVGHRTAPSAPSAADDALQQAAVVALQDEDAKAFAAALVRLLEAGRTEEAGTLFARARGRLSPSSALSLVEAELVEARGGDPTPLLRSAVEDWPRASAPVERLALAHLRRGFPRAAQRLLQQRPRAAPALSAVLLALLSEPRDRAALERSDARWRPLLARWVAQEGIRRAAWYRRRGKPGARVSAGAVATPALRASARLDLEGARRLGLDAALTARVVEASRWIEPEPRAANPAAERAAVMMAELEGHISGHRSGLDRTGVRRGVDAVLALDPANARALLVRASLGNVLDPSAWSLATRAITLDPSSLTRLHRRVRERVYVSRGLGAEAMLAPLVSSADPVEAAIASALAVELERGDVQASLRRLNAVLRADPGNVPARAFRIYVASRAGRLEQAEADHRALAEEIPNNGLATFYGALLLARRSEPAARVLAAMKRAAQQGVRGIVTSQLRSHGGTYTEIDPYATLPAFRRLFFAEGAPGRD